MILFRRFAALALIAGLATLFPAQSRAEDAPNAPAPNQADTAALLQRVTELEKEVKSLQGELQAVKASPAAATAGNPAVIPAVYDPQSAAPAAAPAPSKPDPLAGLSSVLGGATFTGLVDGYYSYNFNHPQAGTSSLSPVPGNFTALRVFDPRNNQFALSLVEVGLVKTPDADNRLGYKAIFGFGDAMRQINVVSGGDPTFLQYLKEAYFSYLAPVGKGLQFDVGKFVTPNGAEVIESSANWNYSRSLLFNYAIPFYHYGIRAQYAFSPKVSLTGYVVNGWNDVIHDTSTGFDNSGKTGGLSLVWAISKKVTFTQNWMGGPGATQLDGNHWRNLSDTVIAYNPTGKLSLMANGDYGRTEGSLIPVDGGAISSDRSKEWWGAAGYIKYQFNPKYALAARYEYYNDPDGYTTGITDLNGHGPHIQEVTATFERRFATHLITRIEYRHDESNQAFFPKGRASNLPVNGQNTIAAGMVFVFEPSESK